MNPSWMIGSARFRLESETRWVLPQQGRVRIEHVEPVSGTDQIALLLRDYIPLRTIQDSASSGSFLRVCTASIQGGLVDEVLRVSPEELLPGVDNRGVILSTCEKDKILLMGTHLWWATDHWSFEPVGMLYTGMNQDLRPVSAVLSSRGLVLAYSGAEEGLAEVLRLNRDGGVETRLGIVGSDALNLHCFGEMMLATDLHRMMVLNETGIVTERDLASHFPEGYRGIELVGFDGECFFLSNGVSVVMLDRETLAFMAKGTLPEPAIALTVSKREWTSFSVDESDAVLWMRRYVLETSVS